MKFNLLTIACASVVCTAANAATIEVPRHYPSIQQAIDAAAPGDVVSVDPGTYRETLVIIGKDLRLECSSSAGGVVIDGDERFRCMECHGVTSATSISGFTFQDGASPVLHEPSSFPSNPRDEYEFRLSMRGGGVLLHNADVQFGNCSFISNKAFEGSALYSWLSTPSFDSCSFVGNGMGYLEYDAPGSSVAINTLGRGTAAFSQCDFRNSQGGKGAIVVYPVELDSRRITRRPRKASPQAVKLMHTTIQGSLLARNANVIVENCLYENGWLGDGGISGYAVGVPLDWTMDSRYHRAYLPASGKWSLSLSDCKFVWLKGRAVWLNDYEATLNDNSINHCEGGIAMDSSVLTCRNCEFEHLGTSAGSCSRGGGISAYDSTLDLLDCRFANCATHGVNPMAFSEGGGLFVQDCETIMADSVVENCYADRGGFLMMWEGTFKGDSNQIRSCKAVDAAILMCVGLDARYESKNTSYSNSMTVTERNLELGSSRQSIFQFEGAEAIFMGDRYEDLHARASGGSVEETIVSMRRSEVIYDGLEMKGCSAETADLILVSNWSKLYLENSEIHHNIAGARGHVVANSGSHSELHIFQCEFAANVAKPKPGGSASNAVVHSNGTLGGKMTTVADTHFCGNRMTAFDGPWTDNGGVTFSRRCTSP
jgi:hypothetical protein